MGSLRLSAISVHLDARTVNYLVKEQLGQEAESVTHNAALRKAIGGVFIEKATPFVPMKTGHLRDTAFAEGDGRVDWPANYASTQYETQYNHYTTPGTGPYWADRVISNEDGTYDAFIADITPLIIAAFNKSGTAKTGAGNTAKMNALYKKAKNGAKKVTRSQMKANKKASKKKKGKAKKNKKKR